MEFGQAHSARLASKIVVDIANPPDDTLTGLNIEPTTSAAEERARVLHGSSVVKAFNTQPATVRRHRRLHVLDAYIASDDAVAKTVVLDLLHGSGVRGIDAGKLANARLLERLRAFGMDLAERYHTSVSGFRYLPGGALTKPP